MSERGEVGDRIGGFLTFLKQKNLQLSHVGISQEDLDRLRRDGILSEAKFRLTEIRVDAELGNNIENKTQLLRDKLKPYLERSPEKKLWGMIPSVANVLDHELAELQKTNAGHHESQTQCSEVNLTAEMGPKRDQDSVGVCGAFAAADLLSFILKKRVSAADVMIANNIENIDTLDQLLGTKDSKRHGAVPSDAIVATLKRGVCLEADFPSENFGNDSYLLKAMEDAEKLTAELQRKARGRSAKKVEEIQECDLGDNPYRRLARSISMEQIRDIARNTTPGRTMTQLNEIACRGKRFRPQSMPALNMVENPDHISALRRIDQNLNQKRPIAIGYDVYRFEHLRDPDRTHHASNIIGRHWNREKQQCEYLIRNTWGTQSCASHPPEFPCKNGDFWVSQGALINAVWGLYYVE